MLPIQSNEIHTEFAHQPYFTSSSTQDCTSSKVHRSNFFDKSVSLWDRLEQQMVILGGWRITRPLIRQDCRKQCYSVRICHMCKFSYTYHTSTYQTRLQETVSNVYEYVTRVNVPTLITRRLIRQDERICRKQCDSVGICHTCTYYKCS